MRLGNVNCPSGGTMSRAGSRGRAAVRAEAGTRAGAGGKAFPVSTPAARTATSAKLYL